MVSGKFERAIAETSAQFREVLQKRVGRLARQQDILWWGQARYSHALRMPYRRIKDPDLRLWWMAWELAGFAKLDEQGTEIEPSASFLVEILRQSGEDVDEQRPLHEWIQRLMDAVRSPKMVPAVSPPLAKLAAKDATGLPVTWARLQAAKPGSPANTADATEAVALDLSLTIDRGQWAAWLFREALLDIAIGAL
jgi:hypothetical protein